MKKILAIFVAVLLAIEILPINLLDTKSVFAENATFNSATLMLENKYGSPGTEVEVNLNIQNNPGIAGATLNIEYASQLTITNAEAGDAWKNLTFTVPAKFDNPSTFLWDSERGMTMEPY